MREINKKEFEEMIEADIVSLEKTENENLQLVRAGSRKHLKKYHEYYEWARAERLVYFEKNVLLWLFPPKIFRAFRESWNMSYLFDGSPQSAYYRLYNIKASRHSVTKFKGRFILTDYSEISDVDIRSGLRELINIDDDKRKNNIGKPLRRNHYPLSKRWFKKAPSHLKLQLKKNLFNFFNNNCRGDSGKLNLWTVFKDFESYYKGDGYSKNFLSKSIRSTNAYRDTKNLAYCVNVIMNPKLSRFFETQGISINNNMYALAECIQWIWRSRIRNFEHRRKDRTINLYIPSMRMRNLLINWLDGELPN